MCVFIVHLDALQFASNYSIDIEFTWVLSKWIFGYTSSTKKEFSSEQQQQKCVNRKSKSGSGNIPVQNIPIHGKIDRFAWFHGISRELTEMQLKCESTKETFRFFGE